MKSRVETPGARKTGRKRGGLLAVTAISVVLAAIPFKSSLAEAPAKVLNPSSFILDRPAAPTAGDRVAKPGQPLLVQPLHAARAARLEQDVSVNFSSDVFGLDAWRKREVKAGTLLFSAYDGDERVFCASSNSDSMWGSKFPCFVDADGDGAFESSNLGLNLYGKPQLAGVLNDGQLIAFEIEAKRLKSLSSPVRYTVIDYKEGPATTLVFKWQIQTSGRGLAPGAKRINLWSEVGHLVDKKASVDFQDGRPTQVRCSNARFTILAVNADGSLSYRIDSPEPDWKGQLPVPPPITPMMITIYT